MNIASLFSSKLLAQILNCGVAAMLLMVSVNTALAGSIKNQTLMYSVDYAGQNAGELEVIIETKGNQLSVTSHSHLSLLARMFLSAQTSKANFKIDGESLQLTDGADYQQKDQSLIRRFKIEGSVITLDSGEQIAFQSSELLDTDIFPVALIASDLNTLPGRKVLVVSGKRVRADIYQAVVKEAITTPDGKMETSRVTRLKENTNDNFVTYWLDKDQIPVKILSEKKGKKTILTLLP